LESSFLLKQKLSFLKSDPGRARLLYVRVRSSSHLPKCFQLLDSIPHHRTVIAFANEIPKFEREIVDTAMRNNMNHWHLVFASPDCRYERSSVLTNDRFGLNISATNLVDLLLTGETPTTK